MEVICLSLGIIIGGLIGFFFGYILYGRHSVEKELELEEKKAEIRLQKQRANFYSYNGTSEGQEDLDKWKN